MASHGPSPPCRAFFFPRCSFWAAAECAKRFESWREKGGGGEEHRDTSQWPKMSRIASVHSCAISISHTYISYIYIVLVWCAKSLGSLTLWTQIYLCYEYARAHHAWLCTSKSHTLRCLLDCMWMWYKSKKMIACESKNSHAIIGCLHAYRSFDRRFLLSLDK